MRRIMQKQFAKIDRFTTYSTLEVNLYADFFGIPRGKIDSPYSSKPPGACRITVSSLLPEKKVC